MAVQDESGPVRASGLIDHTRMIRWLHWAPWLLLLLGLFAQIQDPGSVLSSLRLQVWDYYQRTAPRAYIDTTEKTGTAVRYLDIDNESLRRYGQWPWSRRTMAQIVTRAKEMGAKVLVFDILFAEADRTSPAKVLADLPADSQGWVDARNLISTLPSHDDVFAEAIQQMPVVLGMALNDGALARKPALKVNPAKIGDGDPLDYLPKFSGAQVNLPEIEAAAAGIGSFNAIPDFDGIIRRVPVLLNLDGQIVPSLSAEAIRVLSGTKRIGIKMPGASDEANFGQMSGISRVKAGNTTIETTEDGFIWLHFTRREPARRIAMHDLLEPGANAADVAARMKDAIVFVGTTAEGLRDIRGTPIDLNMPGVEVHVMATEQMLLGQFLMRPDYAFGVELLFSLALGLAVLGLIRRVSPYWIAFVAFGGIVAAFGFSLWSFVLDLRLYDPVSPSLIIGLVFASAAIVRFIETESERRTVRNAFSQYLAPGVVEEIAKDPSKLKLGGTTRDLTVLFCDIRGFTSIAESFRTDPQSLTKLINRVLTPLSQSVLDSKGTIDKYIGDCIMAFWNAPLDDADHAFNACKCILEMQDKLRRLNEQLDAEGFYKQHKVKRIAVGIGINSGPCVVGNMGSDQRFDYSALGDAVNLAARFQTLSGNYGSLMVVGEDTVALIPESYAFLEIDYVTVKGRATPARLYALMGSPEVKLTPDYIAIDTILQELFAAIRAKQWEAARAAIAKGRALPGFDKTIFDTFEARLSSWAKTDLPDDWNGAWTALEK
ncbi:MAG TPA: adenylate/guanylate cyclase domain-containing protein [Alphaproteobacteria bacterium]|nr:adenylate/guanylate cyclase domain-containing protein [Alphaproteobacteria bacterium]